MASPTPSTASEIFHESDALGFSFAKWLQLSTVRWWHYNSFNFSSLAIDYGVAASISELPMPLQSRQIVVLSSFPFIVLETLRSPRSHLQQRQLPPNCQSCYSSIFTILSQSTEFAIRATFQLRPLFSIVLHCSPLFSIVRRRSSLIDNAAISSIALLFSFWRYQTVWLSTLFCAAIHRCSRLKTKNFVWWPDYKRRKWRRLSWSFTIFRYVSCQVLRIGHCALIKISSMRWSTIITWTLHL